MKNLDRFKFRYFDTFMSDVVMLNVADDYAVVRFSYADEFTPDDEVKISNGILMQSTGLRDKNDKLIYEGDVVKDYDEILSVVYYNDNQASFLLDTYDWENSDVCSMYGLGDMSKYEVIGNIHENPELLEKNKE